MISLELAREKILENAEPLSSEEVDLMSAWGRVLASDVYAGHNVPPNDNSAMDGYAVRAVDLKKAGPDNPLTLKVVGEVAAGTAYTAVLQKGEAVSIMTGAPVPKGADSIVPVEYTRQTENQVSLYISPRSGDHIRRAGEDLKQGNLILHKGQSIAAAQLGILASLGLSRVTVVKRPRIAILATGNELQAVGEPALEYRIYNSNSYTLTAQVLDAGAEPVNLGIAPDNIAKLKQILSKADNCQILITSGGVSMGKYDLMQAVFKDLGMELVFWKVAIKPGKPSLFGRCDKRLVFGLPGNPVASMVTFEAFIRPAIYKLLGKKQVLPDYITAIATENIKKKPGRKHLVRVMLTQKDGRYYATTTGQQGSGMLSSMLGAAGLMIIPADSAGIAAGETATVQLLNIGVVGTKNV
jgi:molybdopterin molybdotransferase